MDARISKIIEFIDENIGKDLTLEKTAPLAALSPDYLSVLFKKETGMRFIKYLKEKRIARARFMLKSSDLEIKKIYTAVGYRNVQDFYHDFKKATGTTPWAYRKKSRS